MRPVHGQGGLAHASGTSHHDHRRQPTRRAGTWARGAAACQASQRAKLRLTVDERANACGQLTRHDPGTTRVARGGMEVHAAGHVARLHHVAPDRGIPDLAACLARVIAVWWFSQDNRWLRARRPGAAHVFQIVVGYGWVPGVRRGQVRNLPPEEVTHRLASPLPTYYSIAATVAPRPVR